MLNILKLPKTRWGAVFGHLLISLAILFALYLIIILLMFPGALFRVAGGIDGLIIVTGVDIILGPLLTLIIYNINKPRHELYRDLTIVGAIQILALSAGMFLVHKSRPAAVTFVFDSFYTVKIDEFKNVEASLPDNLNWFTPQYYYLDLPADDQQALSVVASYEMTGESPQLRSDLYLPLNSSGPELASILRIGQKEAKNLNRACLQREVLTAFDVQTLCFNMDDYSFSFPASE